MNWLVIKGRRRRLLRARRHNSLLTVSGIAAASAPTRIHSACTKTLPNLDQNVNCCKYSDHSTSACAPSGVKIMSDTKVTEPPIEVAASDSKPASSNSFMARYFSRFSRTLSKLGKGFIDASLRIATYVWRVIAPNLGLIIGGYLAARFGMWAQANGFYGN